MYKFSQKLRKRIIAYFLQEHKVVITNEKAEQYLDSLADFYLALSQKKGTKQAF